MSIVRGRVICHKSDQQNCGIFLLEYLGMEVVSILKRWIDGTLWGRVLQFGRKDADV